MYAKVRADFEKNLDDPVKGDIDCKRNIYEELIENCEEVDFCIIKILVIGRSQSCAFF